MRRQIIGRAAGGCGNQHAIANQLFHPHIIIDRNSEFGGLRGFAQKRNLVNRQRLVVRAVDGHGLHPKRVQHRKLGTGDARVQVFFLKRVHQKPDGAVIHAENRCAGMQAFVQRLQH